MSETSDRVRKMFSENDDIRDAGLTVPDDIDCFNDIVYGDDPVWQAMDIYRPTAAKGKKLPVIVAVHGGGWVYGDKERNKFYTMSLAQRGFAVVNFTYRLAPENKYPSSLEDTNKVFAWVLAHGDEYDMDTGHIFAVGDSAGAHCLGLYAGVCTNPDYAGLYDFKTPAGFAPKAIALNCGCYQISLDEETDDLTRALMADFLPEKGTAEELERINVVHHVTKDFPPCFIMTCTGDFLVGEPPALIARLTEAEVPFIYRFYGNPEESLGHVFHCSVKTPQAAACNDDECAFFKSFLKDC